MEFARQHHNNRLLIESLATLGGTYYFSGEPDRGLPRGEESVERARQLGDDFLLGWSLMGYLLCADIAEPARSEQLFAEAITCAERAGDQLFSSLLHNNAGVHALREPCGICAPAACSLGNVAVARRGAVSMRLGGQVKRSSRDAAGCDPGH